MAALVLCPVRREDSEHLFSETRLQLRERGICDVHRMQGYDLQKSIFRAQGCAANEVVMKAFEDTFLRRAMSLFENDPGKKIVFFVEDDMTLRKSIGHAELRACMGDTRSSAAVWIGCPQYVHSS